MSILALDEDVVAMDFPRFGPSGVFPRGESSNVETGIARVAETLCPLVPALLR
jgi:hypothetical protein